MLKKVVLFALLVLPLGAFAQEKIAYYNQGEVVVLMPEYKQMMDSLQKLKDSLEKELRTIQDDYTKKYEDYMKESEGLIESIKLRRLQEIASVEERAKEFSAYAENEMYQAQKNMLEPIFKKLRDAVQAVGAANNFLYIINGDPQLLHYISPNAIDATPLVQKQLKL